MGVFGRQKGARRVYDSRGRPDSVKGHLCRVSWFECGCSFPQWYLQDIHLRASTPKSSHKECLLKWLILTNIWVGEALNAKVSTLPGTFLWLSVLSLSLSVECVYVHANTLVGYLTRLDWSPLTYVWSFCKHVSTGKHSTCMHNTHRRHPRLLFVCAVPFLSCVFGDQVYLHVIIAHLHLKWNIKKGYRNVGIEQKSRLTVRLMVKHMHLGLSHISKILRHSDFRVYV